MWTRLNPRPELPLAVDSGSSSEDDCRNKQAPLDTAEKKASRLLDQSEPPSIRQLHDVFAGYALLLGDDHAEHHPSHHIVEL